MGAPITESECPLTIHEFSSTLWRRKLTVAVSVVVCVAAALAYSKIQTPTYQSTALIQMNTQAQNGQTTSPITFADPLETLGSTSVQLEAARIMKDPDVAALSASVTGAVDPTTGSLSISATGPSPLRAQRIARAFSTAFLDQIQAKVTGQTDKINNQINQVKAQISSLQAQNTTGADSVAGAEIASLTTTLGSLQTQLSAIQLVGSYAQIQVAAGLPGSPEGLGRSKLIAIGIIAGLLVGCGLALVRDEFDNRLRTSPEIGSITDAPILAALPQDADVRSGRVSIALVQAPQSQMSEAVRELRTSLRVILDDTSCPMVMVTSPEASDGKTFVTANLAAAWAMSGSKVIVVSADFRRPRLEEIFGLTTGANPGLAELIRANWKSPESDDEPDRPGLDDPSPAPLVERRSGPSRRPSPARADYSPRPSRGDTSVNSLLMETGIWGLQILPAGIQLDNPSELFGSPGMQPVIDQLPRLADVVLFDTPPVLAAPDSAVIGQFAHGTFVVASEGKTDRDNLERTIHRLEATGSAVLGVVLNRVRRSSADSYYSYSYSNPKRQ